MTRFRNGFRIAAALCFVLGFLSALGAPDTGDKQRVRGEIARSGAAVA